MIRYFIFLIAAVFCTLEILQPNTLANYYQNHIVPSVTANFGNPYYNDTYKGSLVFLPNSQDPCSTLSSEFDADTIVFISNTNLKCDYAQVAYEIQLSGGGGVIFNSTSSNYLVGQNVISLPNWWNKEINIFAAMVSYISTFSWKNYGDSQIQLSFYSTPLPLETSDIYIVLTGDHILDTQFIADIYKYLMPLSIEDANIEIFFNYYTCKSCSTNDCYSDGLYCLNDSMSTSTGRSMINQTLFEINLLTYVIETKNVYSDFFTYIKVISEQCKSDYSDSCSNSVLEWLGFDSDNIQMLNNNSWVSAKNNDFSNNIILKNQILDWKNYDLWFAPSITINNVKFLGGMNYFSQFFCGSFSKEPLSCDGFCGSYCKLSMVDDGICESQCSKSTCSLDIEDCKSFSSSSSSSECNSTLLSNSVCDKICNTTQYNYDNWTCLCQCNSTLLNNGVCDSDCNTEICNYDNNACSSTSQCNCTDELLENEVCDPECNTEECNYDNYSCNSTKDDSDDKSVSITKSQIALIVGIIGGSFLLLILGSIILCFIYRRSKYTSSSRSNDFGGESRISEINEDNAENPRQNPYQDYANRLPSRINLQQRSNSDPRIMQYPDILNSEMAASNEDSEASKPAKVSDLGYEFYGDPICTICLEKVSKRKQEITGCLHIFHKKCLKEWTNKKGKASLCPNCNKNIS